MLWGAAWPIGYPALDALPWVVAIPVGVVLSAAALLLTRLARSEEVVSGWERRVQLSWLVLMASSPLLAATINPAPARTVLIFLGALWGGVWSSAVPHTGILIPVHLSALRAASRAGRHGRGAVRWRLWQFRHAATRCGDSVVLIQK